MTLTTVYPGNEARGFVARKAAGAKTRPRAWLGPSVSEYDPDTDSGDGVECPTCSEQFVTKALLGRHHNASHGETLKEYQNRQGSHSCPYEGCSFASDTEHGVKIHHADTHDESIAGVDVECAWCGETKTVIQSQKERSENHFCDPQCHGKWAVENRVGEDSPAWDGGQYTTVECHQCGGSTLVRDGDLRRFDRHFCKESCIIEWRKEFYSGETNPKWKPKITVACAHCGNTKDVHQSVYENAEIFFCDDSCRGGWNKENLHGEYHPRWDGGGSAYIGWSDETKERIREQQNRRCADCGEHESKHPRRLDVHHIHKARYFDDPDERDAESNLVALCRSCHLEKWEKMSPLRPHTPHLG